MPVSTLDSTVFAKKEVKRGLFLTKAIGDRGRTTKQCRHQYKNVGQPNTLVPLDVTCPLERGRA